MKIGILGAGNIGGNLGRRWVAGGHEVLFGVRDAHNAKVQALLDEIGSDACAANVVDAFDYGEVVLLALPWQAVQETLEQAGDLLKGKILIDATNRLGAVAPGSLPSAAEDIAKWVPEARVVKAFNSLGAEHLLNTQFGSQQADTFICGDDEAAKAVVKQLAEDIGFGVIDAGSLSNAHLLESLAKLWITLSRRVGREIAFKLLQR